METNSVHVFLFDSPYITINKVVNPPKKREILYLGTVDRLDFTDIYLEWIKITLNIQKVVALKKHIFVDN